MLVLELNGDNELVELNSCNHFANVEDMFVEYGKIWTNRDFVRYKYCTYGTECLVKLCHYLNQIHTLFSLRYTPSAFYLLREWETGKQFVLSFEQCSVFLRNELLTWTDVKSESFKWSSHYYKDLTEYQPVMDFMKLIAEFTRSIEPYLHEEEPFAYKVDRFYRNKCIVPI